MGVGATGSTNAPNQPTNAGPGGDTPHAETAAKAKFGEALKHEKIDLNIHGDPDRFKSCSARDDGPDYMKPIPKSKEHSFKLPDTLPSHDTTPNGTHIFGIERKF